MTFLLALLLAACDFEDTAPPDTDTDEASCLTGFVEPLQPELVLQDVQVGGIAINASWEADVTRDGQPAACINQAGTEVRWVLTVEGEPQGMLSIFAAREGEIDLSERQGQVRVELLGPDFPDQLVVNQWDFGSVLVVDQVGDTFEFSVTNALGLAADGTSVSLDLNGSASVP